MAGLVLHLGQQDRLAAQRGRAGDPVALGLHADDLGVRVLGHLADQRGAVLLRHPVARLDPVVARDDLLELQPAGRPRRVDAPSWIPPGPEPLNDLQTDRSVTTVAGTQRRATKGRSRERTPRELQSPGPGSAPRRRRPAARRDAPATRSRASRSTGLDLAAMADHARSVGGPALRALTFHERAGAAQGAGQGPRPTARTSSTNSRPAPAPRAATRWSTSTAASAPSSPTPRKGVRELPNDTVVLDGDPEPLGRGGTFLGQHVYTSRPGVDVQINAFNFPVWGMLEKLAPALARRPADHRQAGQPDRVPHRAAWCAASSSPASCPTGALQLLCGSPDGLLEQLGAQDSIAFTGSAATAALAAPAPVRAAWRRPPRRRGRLAELLDPRPRRDASTIPSSTCSSRASSPR